MAVDDLRTGTWVTYSHGRPKTLEVRRSRLTVIAGPDTGKVAELDSTWIRVGAHERCDLVLTDKRISGSHFEIQLDDRGYRIRDLDSTNGTRVAGHRVKELYLNPGSCIDVGETRIRFEPLSKSSAVALSDRDQFAGLVGGSPPMRAVYAKLERIAPSDASVLVTGETGVGKELIAEAVHLYSSRKDGPFEIVDCGSVARNLIEGELFGYERGAFTGAVNSHAGVFERAHGGTVFLDELGELPVELQPKLLGVLERREVRRLGGRKPIPVDIRVVAATNRDLIREMNKGLFREDLYYRLAVALVHVPPLRERIEDIPALVEHFLTLIPGADGMSLRPATVENLMRHDYPGNVRELRNLIERSVLLSDPEAMEAPWADGAGPAGGAAASGQGSAAAAPGDGALTVPIDVEVPFKQAKGRMVSEFEKRFLRKLLKKFDGNVSRAARATGLDRMTVHKMLSRAGLTKSKN